jgi:hypothetical protein
MTPLEKRLAADLDRLGRELREERRLRLQAMFHWAWPPVPRSSTIIKGQTG